MQHAAEQCSAVVEPAWYLVAGHTKRAQEPVEHGGRGQRLLVRVVAAKVGVELAVGEPVPRPVTPVQGQTRLPDFSPYRSVGPGTICRLDTTVLPNGRYTIRERLELVNGTHLLDAVAVDIKN